MFDMAHLWEFLKLLFGIAHLVHAHYSVHLQEGQARVTSLCGMMVHLMDTSRKWRACMDRASQALKLSSMYVSQVMVGLLCICTDTDSFISLFCTLSFIHTHMCTYTYIYSHA